LASLVTVHIIIFIIASNVCPSLPIPANGSMNCQYGGDGILNPGDSCRFQCDTGFKLQGKSRRTCMLRNGVASWTGNDSDNAMCVRGMEFTYILTIKMVDYNYSISVAKWSILILISSSGIEF